MNFFEVDSVDGLSFHLKNSTTMKGCTMRLEELLFARFASATDISVNRTVPGVHFRRLLVCRIWSRSFVLCNLHRLLVPV